jgi:hypothetical protein
MPPMCRSEKKADCTRVSATLINASPIKLHELIILLWLLLSAMSFFSQTEIALEDTY